MPGSPAAFPRGPRGNTQPLGLSAGKACAMGSSQCPGSRVLANITFSILISLLYTLELEPQTWSQLFHLERHRDGRGSLVLSFIQPAFTVPEADSVIGTCRIVEDRHRPFPHGAYFLWGSQRTKSAAQTDIRNGLWYEGRTLSLALRLSCCVAS